MKYLLAASSLFVCVLQTAASAQVDSPPDRPFLRIDPGMHTAVIRRLAADEKCSMIATGSEDKSIRLWSAPDGKLLNTIRPPIGEDDNGKIYAVAMSPDGNWLAAAGWTLPQGRHWVYVFDRKTGDMKTSFGPTGNVITHLAISQDGRYLAATLRNGGGLRVWKRNGEGLSEWSEAGDDRNYGKQDAQGAVFDKEGNLYTAGYDRRIRRYPAGQYYDPNGWPARGGLRPHSIAVHPSGNRIAVGFSDALAADVYDVNSTNLLYRTDTKGMEAAKGRNLQSVAWLKDGSKLFAGGSYEENNSFPVISWNDEGRGRPEKSSGAINSLQHLTSCGDSIAVAASDPAFGLLDQNGKRRFWKDSTIADMRGKTHENFLVSADGMRVRFGLKEGAQQPVLFDVRTQELIESPKAPDGMKAADSFSIPVERWDNHPAPRLGQTTLRLDTLNPGERSLSLSVMPGKQVFVLGTDNQLIGFDKEGNRLWRHRSPAAVWGLNEASGGKLIVAALGDGTVRWYSRRDDNSGIDELLALFVHAKNNTWAAWTPRGYFAVSAGGEQLIGWQVNRSWGDAGIFYTIGKFRDDFYRPDIIQRILADMSESVAVAAANQKAGGSLVDSSGLSSKDVVTALPPVINILSPENNSSFPQGEVTLEYSVRSPAGLPVKRIFATVNGQRASGAEQVVDYRFDQRQQATGKITLRIPANDVTIRLFAETEEKKASEPATLQLKSSLGATAPSQYVPRLFVLAIGVGRYAHKNLDLGEFPANDAEDIVELMQQQVGPKKPFRSIEHRLITSPATSKGSIEATERNIKDGIEWLIANAKNPSDVALVYFSGHGMSTAQSAFLLPQDYDPSKISTAIEKSTLRSWLTTIDAKVIFAMDACHAADGIVLSTVSPAQRLNTIGVGNEFSSMEKGGIVVFASSTAMQRSYSKPGNRNSYFSQAFLEGLRGSAPSYNSLIVHTDLISFLVRKVQELSDRKQLPVLFPSAIEPIPLAFVQQRQ